MIVWKQMPGKVTAAKNLTRIIVTIHGRFNYSPHATP